MLELSRFKNIIKLIMQCKENGKTIIFSSHRLGEIRSLCDDLAIIHKGQLYFNGSYSDFESQNKSESLEDEFIRLVGEQTDV